MRWRALERLRRTTLRTRLTIWNTAVVILLAATMLLVVRFAARQALYADTDAELRAACREIALAIRAFEGDEGPIVAELRRKVASHEERGWFLHLLHTDGTTIWKSDHCPAEVASYPPADLQLPETVRQVGPFRYVRSRIDRSVGPSYLLRLGTYTTGLDERLSGLMRLLTALGIGLAAITPLAAYWLAGRATKPLGSMLHVAERLSPTRLTDRLPVRGTSDELDLLARTINGLLDRVARHVDAQEQFVADAAHELRGPLAGLQSSLEVAAARTTTTQAEQDELVDMLEAARHLSKVANDLLLLAESGNPTRPTQHAIIDLATVARQAEAMFSGVAEEKGIRLRIRSDGPVDACGDPVELRRLLSNLLDNAIRFTPPCGTIEVQAVTAGAWSILTVTDTGSGIAAGDLDRVFDRFFKADPARTPGSSGRSGGLGLSICRSIAESCGGTIAIASRLGEGTQVVVRLPARPPAGPVAPPPDERLASAGQSPHSAGW